MPLSTRKQDAVRVCNVYDYDTAASAADNYVDNNDDGNEDDEVLVMVMAVVMFRNSHRNSRRNSLFLVHVHFQRDFQVNSGVRFKAHTGIYTEVILEFPKP